MTRFSGHLESERRRCPDDESEAVVCGRVPAADGGVGPRRAHTQGAGAGVWVCGIDDPHLGPAADLDEGLREDGLTTLEREESRGLVRSGDRDGTGEVFELVKANQAEHRVATLCRVLGVSPSGYYAWRRRRRSERRRRDEELRGMIRSIHKASRGTYGVPRVHAELAEGGVRVSRKRVARLMREEGLAGVSRRRGVRTTRADRRQRAAPDRVERQFRADAPDRLWVADITYVPTWTGFMYLAIVLDVFSRKVVGWAMADHLRTELVLGALNMAIGQRRPKRWSTIPTRAPSTRRWPSASAAVRWGC